MSAVRAVLGQAFRQEDDDAPVAPRSRRDWIVDSVLFLLAALLAFAAAMTSATKGLHGPLLAIDATGAAMACLALWWRRRWPLGVGLAVVAVLTVSQAAGVAGVVTLYTVAAYRRWQLAFLVAAAQFALLPLARAIEPQGSSLAVYYLGGTLGPAVVVAWGMFRRTRMQAQRERSRRVEAQEQLRIEQVRYAERTRIAREMHDVLAHRISLLSLHAGALEFRPDAPAAEVARAAAVIRASAHQALEDLRAVIGVLRDGPDGPGPEPPQPTLVALPGLLEESRAAGMGIQAEVGLPDLAAVPDAIGRHALRIVQEALTNARKHATAAPVELRLDGAPGDGLTIEVRNPTLALATAESKIPGTGAGLLGLAERATLSGGRLEHGLDEHGQFRLHAWLPWQREAQ
ncbi:MAG: sensor histidine kinase [Streptosporangiaceae bacterium]|nr:sensor histidine kinase [Streptosporangiaceae bacterium]